MGLGRKTVEDADHGLFLDAQRHAHHGNQPQVLGHFLFFESGLIQDVLQDEGLIVGRNVSHHTLVHI